MFSVRVVGPGNETGIGEEFAFTGKPFDTIDFQIETKGRYGTYARHPEKTLNVVIIYEPVLHEMFNVSYLGIQQIDLLSIECNLIMIKRGAQQACLPNREAVLRAHSTSLRDDADYCNMTFVSRPGVTVCG